MFLSPLHIVCLIFSNVSSSAYYDSNPIDARRLSTDDSSLIEYINKMLISPVSRHMIVCLPRQGCGPFMLYCHLWPNCCWQLVLPFRYFFFEVIHKKTALKLLED
ncbi:hypothetical protein XfCFBP8082_02480 [Xylella fastidiosa subsp. fastidiosa]|jgi:hypothetical protein|uniref:Uncharacterized protein n=1 Tax=Xylella fastidiosa (strain M23) TaxID=405441 RepID=B2I752_XYLF2|nr:hypothetical protein XfasM23_0205 [Xylella fastidiosa M23]EGO80870.1 hypothetical protein XFEB_02231 [Xylella fastidiosa EB92.1]NBI37947.1 hypothetical protein [Xylella fastidiosa subsp. fastidiosa]QIS24996.1 hypothetical protein F7G16_01195 [Xylella fastidiosa]RUA35204.1 hypothetical protein DX878_10820 [Xylella fastidiosa subsp. fastidiosa]